jgi:hypothetical protein
MREELLKRSQTARRRANTNNGELFVPVIPRECAILYPVLFRIYLRFSSLSPG